MPAADTERPDVHRDVLDTPEAGGIVVRGGIVRIVGFAVGILCSLGAVVLVTRHLGTDRYGQFQTVLNLLLVVQAITDVGMATLGIREYAQRPGADRERFLRVLLGLRIVLTLAGVTVAVAIAVAAGYGAGLIAGALAGGIGLVLTVMQTTLAIPLGAELRIGTVTALDVGRQAGTASLYALFVVAGAGVFPFLAATVPVQLVLLAVTALLVRGRVSLRPTIDVAAWRALLAASVSFALAIAVGTLYQYTSQILMSFVSTAHETGLFAAAFRTYIVIAAVPGVLVASAFPLLSRAARDDRERLSYALRKLTDVMILVGVAASLVMVVGAPWVIDVIAGHSYAGAVPALRIEGLAMLMAFGITTWGFGLMSVHAHRAMVIANGCSLLVATTMVLVLAPAHGAIGAAWAIVAGETVLAAGYFVALAGRGNLRPRFHVAVRALAAGGVAAGVAFASGLPSLPATVIAVVLYAVLVVVVRAVPQEVVELAPAALRARIVGAE